MVVSLALDRHRLNVIVYHKVYGELISHQLIGVTSVHNVSYKVLVFFERHLDVNTNFDRVLRLYHLNFETIKVLKLLLEHIDAPETSKHVIDLDETSSVRLKLSLKFQKSIF